MVKLWLLRGIKKGILTTKYPRDDPTEDEVPKSSISPIPNEKTNWQKGQEICPTGAIQHDSIDLGKCVYCKRCYEAGFEFNSKPSDNLEAKYDLVVEKGKPSKGQLMKRYERLWKTFRKSFHILMIDIGSCNACNQEVLNVANPYYDLHRLGIFFTNSPKHADALVVVGALNKSMVEVLKRTYESIPNPKLVISVGACSISGGIFQGTEGFVSPVRDAIPVDVVIPGCPPSPLQILQGLLIATGRLDPTDTTNASNATNNSPDHDKLFL